MIFIIQLVRGNKQCQKLFIKITGEKKLGEEFRVKLNYFLKEKVFLVLFCFYFMEKLLH